MATTKTKTIAVRLPTAIIAAIAADAEFVSQTPGAFLREMLVKRYSSPRVAREGILHEDAPEYRVEARAS